MLHRRKKAEQFVPIIEKPKSEPKPVVKKDNPDVKRMSSNPYPMIPKEVLDALSRIETKLTALIESDKKVDEPKIDEPIKEDNS